MLNRFRRRRVADDVEATAEYLRGLGAHIGQGVFLAAEIFVETEWAPLLTIEDGVVIGRGSRMILHDSSLTNVSGGPTKVGPITLRKECYLGHYITVLPGVEIGHHAIVGAASVVTKDVPPETVVAGTPARHICTIQELAERFETDSHDPASKFRYWDIKPWRSHLSKLSTAAHDAQFKEFIAKFYP
ncbi:MAG: hypothetical protein ABR507_09980 [Actinomycetota bacterium]